ncbi:MAG: pilus assembly protein [Candidatus Eremiobacteraeota bacterium]|nr:pilus assembly protein [Candidatus Eremiobacteraeota bacterium]
MVEFAIAVAMLMTMIVGIVDIGRAMYAYHLVANVAQEGARYAAVHGSSCTLSSCPATASAIQTYVRGQATGIDATRLTVTTTWSTGNSCAGSPYQSAGCTVSVQTSYPFTFIVSLLPNFTMTMRGSSQMVISQ